MCGGRYELCGFLKEGQVKGPFKCYEVNVTHWWGGGVTFPRIKCYESVRFSVISITMDWVGVDFPEKKSVAL